MAATAQPHAPSQRSLLVALLGVYAYTCAWCEAHRTTAREQSHGAAILEDLGPYEPAEGACAAKYRHTPAAHRLVLTKQGLTSDLTHGKIEM